MVSKKRNKAGEWIKNLLLICFAVGVVIVFFNLDIMKKGDSMFSRKGVTKLYFRGDLKQKDYEISEVDQIKRYINAQSKIMESATVETRLQDSYKTVTDKSQVTFEVHLVMKDGSRISTSARRSSRGSLVSAILIKLKKDVGAYKKLKKEGKKIKSLINTS